MQSLDLESCCPDCSRFMVDAGDELVCPNCGVVREKEVVEAGPGYNGRTSALGRQALGSYMGSMGITRKERSSRGLTGSNSRYEYLKAVSDFAGRDEGAAITCAKMIDRVGEKLFLPGVVLLEASSIATKVLATEHPHRRFTIAAVSAYSLIAACKVEGATSVSVMEIIGAHAALGRRVTSSSIIQLTLESPIKTFARCPEDYLSRVLARLSMNRGLKDDLASEGVSQTIFFNSLRETAREVLTLVDEEARAGRRPGALAASAIYSAEMVLSFCESRRRRITQRDLAECGDTAEYTIREQCARIFMPAVERLVVRRMQSLPPAPAR